MIVHKKKHQKLLSKKKGCGLNMYSSGSLSFTAKAVKMRDKHFICVQHFKTFTSTTTASLTVHVSETYITFQKYFST